MLYTRALTACIFVLGLAQASCGADAVDNAAKTASKSAQGGSKAQAPAANGATADWPQWRGPQRDAISRETKLLEQWPEGGPKLLWTNRGLGRGYSSPSVVGDRLYVLGTADNTAAAIAVDLNSGEQLWVAKLGEQYENNWGGGPRGSVTVDGDRLYALDAVGNLFCLETENGEKVWQKNLVSDFGGQIPNWGYCESPLVDGDKVVVTAGGPKCVVAFNKTSGDVIWTSTGLDEPAHYSSFIAANIDGVPLYVNQTSKGMVGVHADTGKLLWRYEKTGNGTATIPTPIFHDGHVYGTSGYGTGCGLVKLTAAGSEVRADEVYFSKDMKNHHGGVVLKDGHIYGYSDGGGWLCQNFMTGEVVWRDRDAHGKGSVIYADDRLYCYSENEGALVLAEPSTEGWKEHGRFTIPETTKLERGSGKIWAHPVVSHGKLLLRDQDLLFCFDIQEQ